MTFSASANQQNTMTGALLPKEIAILLAEFSLSTHSDQYTLIKMRTRNLPTHFLPLRYFFKS